MGKQTRDLRVASLLPSATEIICALGKRESLVGVSHECDYPKEVVGLPVLTRSKISSSSSSRGIDRDVRELLRDALAVYDIDLEELKGANPNVIVTQDLCDVCAVSFHEVEEAVKEIANSETRIISLHPTCLKDIWDDIKRVGEALECEVVAECLLKEMDGRVNVVKERGESAQASSTKSRTLTIEWIDPVMIGGLWMPKLVEFAGGVPLLTKPGELAPTLTKDELRNLSPPPDVILVKPCGYTLDQTFKEEETLRDLFRVLPWPAVENELIFITDGNSFFNRPGPRIVDSLEILAACLYPELNSDFAEKYRGDFVRWA